MAHFAYVSQQAFTQKCVSALEDDFQSGLKGNPALGALSRERVLPRAPHGGEAWEGCAVRVAVGPGRPVGRSGGHSHLHPTLPRKALLLHLGAACGLRRGVEPALLSKLGPNKGILKSSIVPRSGQTPSSGSPTLGSPGHRASASGLQRALSAQPARAAWMARHLW